jgi:hypothetical protein
MLSSFSTGDAILEEISVFGRTRNNENLHGW